MAAATWTVTDVDGVSNTIPVLGTSYSGFSAMPGYDASYPDLKTKSRDGRLRLVSPYEFRVIATGTVHGDDLGVFAPSETERASGRRYALDAAATGSTVTIGKEAAPGVVNGKLYIAGKVRAYSAIELNSGTSPDGVDIDLRATGVLETVNGSISFYAGDTGLLQGDVIARGAGSDVEIRSARSLAIQGLVQASDDIVLHGGDGTRVTDANASGYLSLNLYNTATVRTMDAGGSITLSGTNLVWLDGAVQTDLASQAIALRSDQGDLVLNRTSGRVLDGTLVSAIITDDGRVALGAVSPQALADALAGS